MNTALDRRRAGVLLHPTSLPGDGYCGTLGADARRFIELIAQAGLQIWQVLPLGPTHDDMCPYQLLSVHAGNPDLVDLQWLVERDWLTQAEADAGRHSPAAKRAALDSASGRFHAAGDAAATARYQAFIDSAGYWLEDYTLFQAIRDDLGRIPWPDWPEPLRRRQPGACDSAAGRLADAIRRLQFRQFVFQCQLQELRRFANERGILLFGDIPIYVHLESADVWAHQSLFDLDDAGRPRTVTGVPPDYFSAEGQLWGNPQYDWSRMERDGFDWWLARFASAAQQFDIARIDHFRALEAYWEIPATATSARDGHWVHAPGRALLQAVQAAHPELCLVAENLGTISAEVEALRAEFALPGMVILQFAFDGNPENPYLNHRHQAGDIVYTGTHDNDTTLGWFESLDEHTRELVYRYFDNPADSMPWMLIRQAMASPANTAIVPWQDFLGLDGAHRMNTPGTREGNWHWRFQWDQVRPGLAQDIRDLVVRHDRLAATEGTPEPRRIAGG